MPEVTQFVAVEGARVTECAHFGAFAKYFPKMRRFLILNGL